MSRRPSPVGAHVPVGHGLAKQGLAYADQIGATAVQVFLGNPRGWAPTAGDPLQDKAFREGCGERDITAFVHAPYLVNVGSPTPATLTSSVRALRHTLARAGEIGAVAVVVHGGSAVAGGSRERALGQLREHLLPLLDEADARGVRLLVEPTAGGGQPLAAAVDQLPEYLDALERHPAVGICLDTCHAYAAGEDLAAPGGVRRVLRALVRAAGTGRLGLVHANDSKDPLGSSRDRHEALGRGTLGDGAFAALMADRAVHGVPVVVETPGDAAAHADEIARLVRWRDGP